jgi:tetratricopeptide (TPR) repeat protein
MVALRDNPTALPESVRKRYARQREKPGRTRESSDRLSPIRDLLAQSRMDEAWSALEAILTRGPATAPSLALKASLLSELGRWEDAVSTAGEALRLDSASAEAHYETARALSSMKQFNEALAAVEKALQRNPKHPLAWALRGMLMAHQGDAEQVKVSFETAEKYGAKLPGVLLQQAMAMEVMGYPDAALELYSRVVSMAPRHAEARAEMAVTLAALGRRQEAWQATQDALKLNPYQATALEWSARLRHVGGGRPNSGRLPSPPSGIGSELLPRLPETSRPLHVESSITSRDDSDVTTWRRGQGAGHGQKMEGATPLELLKRARDGYERGEFEMSMAAYDQALRQDPRLAGGWYGKGLCATALWQFEEAREALERSARLPDPPQDQIEQARKRLDAMQAFQQQSIRPLLARDPRAWRMLTAPSGAFRLPYPSWCQSFPPSGAGELASIGDRTERPTFLFTVSTQPFVDPRELTTVKHGEQVVDEGELPHAQAKASLAGVEFKEVRDRSKGSFSLRAVLIQGHMAWYLVGTARFHYYAGYRLLFQMMIEDFHLA